MTLKTLAIVRSLAVASLLSASCMGAADTFSGLSGPGEPVVGDGLGGWRSGNDGIRYKGIHPKAGWQLDWDAKETSTDKVIELGLLPPIKPIWELHLRDTIINIGGDGLYYMTGSSGDNIWDRTDGVELWKSADMKTWAYVGLVWSLAKDATWQRGARYVWAPEIHYLKSKKTYVIALCVGGGGAGGTGFLVSSSGKPEGPYVNLFKPDERITGGIDSTIFEDDDGKIYYTSGHGDTIYQLKDDFSGFVDGPHRIELDPESVKQARTLGVRSGVGSEGPSLFKRGGKYYLGGAQFIGGVDRRTGRNGRYSSCVAIADHIYGPYRLWEEAVPCGAGGNYFQDKDGSWYCTYFGNDEASPFREKPGLVRIDFEADGRIKIADEQPAFLLRDGTPTRWRTALAKPAALSDQVKVAYHGRFSELPVGAVQPRGWIKSWLQRQADGLTGHPENLAYPYDTCMFAGKIPPPLVKHGEVWWPYEQSGYLVDGVVRLNLLVDSPDTRRLAGSNLKYILENSGPTKLGESTWGWPNAVVGRALLAEHSATGDARTLPVLTEYLTGPGRRLSRDGFVFEEELYVYRQTGDARLLENARRTYDRFFLSDPRSFTNVEKLRGDQPLREHGVTAAEQLKLLPLMYCYTGDPQALELANLAYRKVEAASLMPDGGMVSSENLGPTAFNSLHESCDLTDWSWSMGYLLMAGGEAHWADLIERTTFNALPGAVTKDFKQLQYFSSANQILASNTACPRIAPTRMSYRAAHDTECCSGNISRAMPNYVTRMWMRMEAGVAATLYGPSEVSTIIDEHPVTIAEATDYPFRETITFKIKVAQPATFALGLRIPEWCAAASVTVNGRPSGTECPAGTFALLRREYRDGDTVVLRLPMTVQLREWFDGRGVSVQRGPLVYSLKIDERRVESQTDSDAIKRVLKGNDIQGFPAVEFFPAGEWRYGMDPAQESAPDQFKVIEAPMPENPFLVGTVPVRIEVPLRTLPQWQAAWQPTVEPLPADLKLAPKNPVSLPDEAELQNPGPARTMTLVPYGSTYLRLTTLPVIKATAEAKRP